MTDTMTEAATKSMTDNLLDDGDKKPVAPAAVGGYRSGDMGAGAFAGMKRPPMDKAARDAAGRKAISDDYYSAKKNNPQLTKPCTDIDLAIPSFLDRTQSKVEAKRCDLALPLEISDGYARMTMKCATDAADRINLYIGDLLEVHGVVWSQEAAAEFRGAAMKALAKCNFIDPETGEYAKIVITAPKGGE